MTAYDDGDETGFRDKGSLGGEYTELSVTSSSPAPLSVELLLLRSRAEVIRQGATYSGRNTDCGSHIVGDTL